MLPNTPKNANRYCQIELLVYEFIHLMSYVNLSVGLLSEESIRYFIDYSVETYDDAKQSNYDFIKEQLSLIEIMINDKKLTESRVINLFNSVSKRINELLPLYLKKETITINFNENQITKVFDLKGKKRCNIRLPENSKYKGYVVTVFHNSIFDCKHGEGKYFVTDRKYFFRLSKYNRRNRSWDRVKISASELKEEMESCQI